MSKLTIETERNGSDLDIHTEAIEYSPDRCAADLLFAIADIWYCYKHYSKCKKELANEYADTFMKVIREAFDGWEPDRVWGFLNGYERVVEQNSKKKKKKEATNEA